MEIRHLKYMLAVAEEGHFNLAAKRLHIAQPALTQNIKQLEQEIGTKLFSRTTRKVALTNAGRLFYDEATKILLQLDAIARDARRASLGEVGSISVGFTETAAYGPLRQVIRRFRLKHPDVQIETRECGVKSLFDELYKGAIDVACTEETVPNPLFEMKSFPDVDVYVAIPEGHRLAESPKSVEAHLLTGESFIFPTQSTTWAVYEKMARGLASAGVRPGHEYWADNAVTGIALVSTGLGLCLVPHFATLPVPGVIYRKLISPRIRITPQLVWMKNRVSPELANLLALA